MFFRIKVYETLSEEQKSRLLDNLKTIPYREAIDQCGITEWRAKSLQNMGKKTLMEKIDEEFGPGHGISTERVGS